MLERAGVRVVTYQRSNDEVSDGDSIAVVRTAVTMRYSRRTLAELGRLIEQTVPDIAHFHNTFPLITASGYHACRKAGVPVVQTLHNYRLLCASANLHRAGRPCELCTPTNFWPAVKHKCYRSTAGSAAVAWMLFRNWRERMYIDGVDQYVALTQFAARKFVAAGIKPESISVKPNFVPSPGPPGDGGGGYVAFVGRFVEEKGLHTLLAAWKRLPHVRLKIVGAGPLEVKVREVAASERLNVEFTGMLSRDSVQELLRRAEFVVVPSEWYEGFPLAVAEAYASATPVLAARIGGLTELVHAGETGELFDAGNPESLANKALELLANPGLKTRMRRACRAWFDEKLSERKNVETLLRIYSLAALAVRGKTGAA